MSNIPKSERDPTKVTHYVKVLDLRKTLIKYLEEDFGIDKYYLEDGSINPRYWLIKKIRDNIYELSQDMVKCITAANTIQIYHLFEYDERRKYFTQAISDCQSIIQELSIVCDYLLIKPGKYEGVINQINDCIEFIKDKRQKDNYFRLQVIERLAREKAKYETWANSTICWCNLCSASYFRWFCRHGWRFCCFLGVSDYLNAFQNVI